MNKNNVWAVFGEFYIDRTRDCLSTSPPIGIFDSEEKAKEFSQIYLARYFDKDTNLGILKTVIFGGYKLNVPRGELQPPTSGSEG